MKRTYLLVVLSIHVTGCGGGGDGTPAPSPPPQEPPPANKLSAGVYSVALDGYPAAGGTSGVMTVLTSGEVLFYGPFIGRGALTYSGPNAHLTLSGPRVLLDERDAESVAAFGANESRSFQFSHVNGDEWRSGTNQITLRIRTPATSIPLRWFFRRPYTLNGVTETYDLRLQTDSAGGISGSDSTGCAFSGSGDHRSLAISSVQLNVTGCGPSEFYIRNGNYTGHLFIDTPGTNPVHTLALVAIRADSQAGITLRLTEER